MTLKEQMTLRIELRKLRIETAFRFRMWESQKEKSERLRKENACLKKKVQELQEKLKETEKKLDKESETKEKYRSFLFKENTKKGEKKGKRNRGGQKGHAGVSRTKPEEINIDKKKDVHLMHCPNCKGILSKTNTFYERIVEDIVLCTKTIITKYRIQRQWCGKCKKEVCATPEGTIEHSPFGVNILIWILIQKYHLRLSLNRITSFLNIQYGLNIAESTLQNLFSGAKEQFGSKYQELISEIRKGKLKHADETGWRIQGQNAWIWMFSNESSIVYTIEETRGKGVPERMLGKAPPGILVRDDYGGYKHLECPQQSCWAHLLRVSKEKTEREGSSKKMKSLHKKLKKMFSELSKIIESDFDKQKRQKAYDLYTNKTQAIIRKKYKSEDVKALQTRIINQNTNLITALKYPNVPLTNNEAERNIRKMVVTRKISGGSRSKKGAEIHAVNMSIIQTLHKRKESLATGLRMLLVT